MSYRKKLARWISKTEDRVKKLKKETRQKRAHIEDRVKRLLKYAEEQASEKEKVRIRRRVARLRHKIAQGVFPSLDEVKREVEEIYGDQSDNSTYYFSRQASSTTPRDVDAGEEWEPTSLDESRKEKDNLYGDQSKNDTWYDLRQSSSHDHSLEDVQRDSDETYGDQSRNDTFYPDVDMEEDKDAFDFPDDEQYMLEPTEFDEYGDTREGDGYFSQDDFSDWSEEKVDLDSYDVDPSVETEGYQDNVTPPHVKSNDSRSRQASRQDYWNDSSDYWG